MFGTRQSQMTMPHGMPAQYHTMPPMPGGGSMFQRALMGGDAGATERQEGEFADAPPPLQGTQPGPLGGGLGFNQRRTPPQGMPPRGV